MQTFTIGQLGKKVGFSSKTIRFYEENGVIQPPERGENGYRLYTESTASQLSLIKQARDLGLSIREIKKLMVGCEQGKDCHHTKQYLDNQIKDYISQLAARIDQFTALKAKLESLQTNLGKDCQDGDYCCNILSQLSDQGVKKGGEKIMNQNCTCCGDNCACGEGCKC